MKRIIVCCGRIWNNIHGVRAILSYFKAERMKLTYLDKDNEIKEAEIDDETLREAKKLPPILDRFFEPADGSFEQSLDTLVHTRARPDGIRNAIGLMSKAYEGQIARRAPIKVRRFDETRFAILDGNSTAIVARAAGWNAILCVLVAE